MCMLITHWQSGDHKYDNSENLRIFKCMLFHASFSAILAPLCHGMTAPVICRCPDRHFRCVIYNFLTFITNYLEQVVLSAIVQNCCPKWVSTTQQVVLTQILILVACRCTANPKKYEVYAVHCTMDHTETLHSLLGTNPLWDKFRIDIDIIVSVATCVLLLATSAWFPLILSQPFTTNFLHANIYQIISPDLLHQVIKGIFKDHLVDWVGWYLL